MAYCGSHHLALGGGTLELRGHVGFDGLPDQLVNKSVQQGFQFNLLIVGETGCGKTTLINSLFKTEFEELEGLEERTHFTPETWIQSATYDIQEKEVCLRLRIDQTVGFGDAIDRSSSMQLVTDYLNKKFEEYLQEEISITRRRRAFSDPRCHACIYMITPCHNSLKSLDFAMLKAIHKSVNVIPVIAKSDNIDRSTLKKLKINIMKELQDAGISTYNFFTEDCGELQAVAPFSIVASNEVIDGRRVRIYPWGTVDIENEDHSDFATLRECLLRYSIYNLIYQTSAVFYSSYRMKRLREMGFLETTDGEREASLEDTYKAKKTQQQSEQKRREAELRNEFSRNVCTKQAELETRKAEMAALHERQMQILTREYQELLSKQDNLEAQLEEVRGFLAQSQQSKGKRGFF